MKQKGKKGLICISTVIAIGETFAGRRPGKAKSSSLFRSFHLAPSMKVSVAARKEKNLLSGKGSGEKHNKMKRFVEPEQQKVETVPGRDGPYRTS